MLKNAAAGALTLFCLGAGLARAEEAGPFKPTSPSGYFFVGGRYETANNRTTALGQMFVSTAPRSGPRSPIRW